MKSLKSTQDFTQNSHLRHLLSIQDSPKGPPLDLIKFPEGLLGGPWGAKCTSQDPPWTPLEIPQGRIVEKSFLENRKTRIYVESGASRGKRASLQNRVFRLLGTPWSPPEADPFRSGPPRSSTKPTLELPGLLHIPQERPGAPKGRIKFRLKTLEICVFDLQCSRKNALG